jgi:hypothetical protein
MARTNNPFIRLKLGMKNAMSSTMGQFRKLRKPHLLGAGAVLALVAGGYLAVRYVKLPNQPLSAAKQAAESALRPSLASLRERTDKNPKDANLWVQLGDAQFAEGHPGAGLHAYSRGMELGGKPSETMLENLIQSFGTKNEEAAAAIVAQYKLDAAEDGLHALTNHRSHDTRWMAVRVLEKLHQVRQGDYIRVALKDLNEPDCGVRKSAVETLSIHGDRSVVKALRAADEKDEDETPMFLFTCLGTKPERAEKAILTRK